MSRLSLTCKDTTFKAVMRSSWSTMPPRAIFIRTELRFILTNALLSNIPRVSSVRLQEMTTISL